MKERAMKVVEKLRDERKRRQEIPVNQQGIEKPEAKQDGKKVEEISNLNHQ